MESTGFQTAAHKHANYTSAQHTAIEPQQRQTQAVGSRTDTMTMTTELPQKSWDSFCQRLKDWYRGAISIRWIQPGGDLRLIAEDLPLQSFVFQK